jgi:hypothetical protein
VADWRAVDIAVAVAAAFLLSAVAVSLGIDALRRARRAGRGSARRRAPMISGALVRLALVLVLTFLPPSRARAAELAEV